MTKEKAGTKETATVRDLPVRQDSDVKGGGVFQMLQSAYATAISSIGQALSTVARKG